MLKEVDYTGNRIRARLLYNQESILREELSRLQEMRFRLSQTIGKMEGVCDSFAEERDILERGFIPQCNGITGPPRTPRSKRKRKHALSTSDLTELTAALNSALGGQEALVNILSPSREREETP